MRTIAQVIDFQNSEIRAQNNFCLLCQLEQIKHNCNCKRQKIKGIRPRTWSQSQTQSQSESQSKSSSDTCLYSQTGKSCPSSGVLRRNNSHDNHNEDDDVGWSCPCRYNCTCVSLYLCCPSIYRICRAKHSLNVPKSEMFLLVLISTAEGVKPERSSASFVFYVARLSRHTPCDCQRRREKD